MGGCWEAKHSWEGFFLPLEWCLLARPGLPLWNMRFVGLVTWAAQGCTALQGTLLQRLASCVACSDLLGQHSAAGGGGISFPLEWATFMVCVLQQHQRGLWRGGIYLVLLGALGAGSCH